MQEENPSKLERSQKAAIPAQPSVSNDHTSDAVPTFARSPKDRFEVVTLIAALVAAVAAAVAAVFGGYQAKIARDTFTFTNRPYVGFDKATIDYAPHDAEGQATPESREMIWHVDIKNYGLLPAKEFRVTWHSYVDGVQSPMVQKPESATILFPGQVVSIWGSSEDPDYSLINNNTKTLELMIQVDYDGPMGHDSYCEKARYNPSGHKFLTLNANAICKFP